MYIYYALMSALSAHMIHVNLERIFYTHVEHSPTTTIYLDLVDDAWRPTHHKKLSVVVVIIVIVITINWLTMFGQGDTWMDDFGKRMRQCSSL